MSFGSMHGSPSAQTGGSAFTLAPSKSVRESSGFSFKPIRPDASHPGLGNSGMMIAETNMPEERNSLIPVHTVLTAIEYLSREFAQLQYSVNESLNYVDERLNAVEVEVLNTSRRVNYILDVLHSRANSASTTDSTDRLSTLTNSMSHNLSMESPAIMVTGPDRQPVVAGLTGNPRAPTRSSVAMGTPLVATNLLHSFGGHRTAINAIAMTPCGTLLASGSQDGGLTVWDLRSGDCVAIFQGHTSGIRALCFSSNPIYLVSGSIDMVVCIWDVRDFVNRRVDDGGVLSLPPVSSLHSGAGMSSNSMSTSGGNPSSMPNYSPYAPKPREVTPILGYPVHVLSGHVHWILSVVATPGCDRVISSGCDKRVLVWNTFASTVLASLSGHNEPVVSLALSEDNQRVIGVCVDRTMHVWSLVDHSRVASIPDGGVSLLGIRMLPLHVSRAVEAIAKSQPSSAMSSPTVSGVSISGSSSSNSVTFGGMAGSSGSVTSGGGDSASGRSNAFHSATEVLLAGSADNCLRSVRLRDGEVLCAFRGHLDMVIGGVWLPKSQADVSGLSSSNAASSTGPMMLGSRTTSSGTSSAQGGLASTFPASSGIEMESVLLASASFDATVRLWDVYNGTCIATLREGSSELRDLAASFSSHFNAVLLAVGAKDGRTLVWMIRRLGNA